MTMKIAIMQPYFFPYIGYYQLVNASDKFIFYDDVNFIKNGWINRNRILVNNSPNYITIQLKGASPFKLINQIEFTDNRLKIGKTIQMAYKKAPYFEQVWPVVNEVLNYQSDKIRDIAIKSITEVFKYLGVSKEFELSSEEYSNTKQQERAERLITICKENRAQTYYNSQGGVKMYSKDYFKQNGLDLYFIIPETIIYKQFTEQFSPNLSIIDVMMFNEPEEINRMLNRYVLI